MSRDRELSTSRTRASPRSAATRPCGPTSSMASPRPRSPTSSGTPLPACTRWRRCCARAPCGCSPRPGPAPRALPISAQSAWQILHEQGLPRLARRENTRRGTPMRLDPVKAGPLESWPAGERIACGHAGLLLLLPQLIELGLPAMTAAAGYPRTSTLSAFHSIATLLLAKCGRISRVHHIDALTEDRGLALMLGLTALPKATDR